MSKIIKDDYNNEINVHDEIYDNHSIKMPIYYWEDEKEDIQIKLEEENDIEILDQDEDLDDYYLSE